MPLPPSFIRHRLSGRRFRRRAVNFFCNPVAAAVGDLESNPAQLVQSFSECEFKCTAPLSAPQINFADALLSDKMNCAVGCGKQFSESFPS